MIQIFKDVIQQQLKQQKIQYEKPSACVYLSYYQIQKMRNIVLSILILTILINKAQTFAIQGEWKLTDIQNIQLSSSHSAKIQIKDFIFRNRTIRWRFIFNGCQTYKAIIDIQGNNIFLDSSTIHTSNQSLQNCSTQFINLQNQFIDQLNRVFTFQNIANFMIFADPDGTVLFKFTRITANNMKNKLLGIWVIKQLNGQKINQIIEINSQNISFCQKLATINYQLVENNKFVFKNLVQDKCGSRNLLAVFNGSKFYVKNNLTLEIYNQSDDLVLKLVYAMDLETAQKLRQQQEQQAKKNVPLPPPPKIIVPSPPTLPLPRPAQITDIFGKWTITKIPNNGNFKGTSVFIITNNTILIANECSTFTLVYSIIIPSPIAIKQQSLKQSQNICKNKAVQQVDKNDLAKIYGFQLQLQEMKAVVRVFDQNRMMLFQIQKPGRIILRPIQPTISAPTISSRPPTIIRPSLPPPRPKPEIQQGRYTILLLQRRSIPRRIVDIINNKFVLKICNPINVIIITKPVQEIQLKIQKNLSGSSPSCDTTHENIFLEAIANIVSYSKDDQDYILKDKNNKELISFNFIG